MTALSTIYFLQFYLKVDDYFYGHLKITNISIQQESLFKLNLEVPNLFIEILKSLSNSEIADMIVSNLNFFEAKLLSIKAILYYLLGIHEIILHQTSSSSTAHRKSVANS